MRDCAKGSSVFTSWRKLLAHYPPVSFLITDMTVGFGRIVSRPAQRNHLHHHEKVIPPVSPTRYQPKAEGVGLRIRGAPQNSKGIATEHIQRKAPVDAIEKMNLITVMIRSYCQYLKQKHTLSKLHQY